MPDYLRRRSEIDRTIVSKRHIVDAGLLKKSREFLREYLGVMDIPSDEDGLIAFVVEKFTEERDKFQTLLISNNIFSHNKNLLY